MEAVRGGGRALVECVFPGRWGYRVHKTEKGRLIIGGGVEFGWVVISWLFEGNVSLELKLGIGGVGGVLVRTVIRGSLRQIGRGSDEVEVEVIVEGEFWGTVRLIVVVYIVMAVHGGGGIVAFCNLCNES